MQGQDDEHQAAREGGCEGCLFGACDGAWAGFQASTEKDQKDRQERQGKEKGGAKQCDTAFPQ